MPSCYVRFQEPWGFPQEFCLETSNIHPLASNIGLRLNGGDEVCRVNISSSALEIVNGLHQEREVCHVFAVAIRHGFGGRQI